MQRLQKTIKYTIRLLFLGLLLLLISAAILQIPAVQNYLTGRLENYLQNKLHTQVNIESIRLSLPESLVLEGFYLEDLQQDTLLDIGALSLNFKLNQLLNQQIQFDNISLIGGKTHLFMNADQSNFDFVVNAFAAPSQLKEVADTTSPDWLITFDHAEILLKEIYFQMDDQQEATSLDLHIGEFIGRIENIDLVENNYRIKQIQLSDSWGNMVTGESNSTAISDSLNPTSGVISPIEIVPSYEAEIQSIILKNVAFDLKTTDTELVTHFKYFENKATSFQINEEDFKINIPQSTLQESNFKYEVSTAPVLTGFDYQHLDLQNISFNLSGFDFDNYDIKTQVNQLSFSEGVQFVLEKFQTALVLTKDQLDLQDIVFKTNHSDIQAGQIQIQYPLLSEPILPLETSPIKADLKVKSGSLSDLRYFYPDLDSIPFFQDLSNRAFLFSTEMHGTLADMNLVSLNWDGLDAQLNASGQLKNLHDVNQLRLDLILHQAQLAGASFVKQIPTNSLPKYVDLPDQFNLSGTIKGHLQQFESNLTAITVRDSSLFPTYLKAKVKVQNISNIDSTYFDLQVDSFSTSKTDIMAYLPPNILPDYVNIPNQFWLNGKVFGQMSKLHSDLKLLTLRGQDENNFKAIGILNNLLTDHPAFDINFDASSISREEIMFYLPDSLLPTYFNLPVINQLKGVFHGNIENFTSQLKIESNTGNWSLDAEVEKEKYQVALEVKKMKAASFFTNGYLDSLTGISFAPLSIDLQLSGQGLDLSEESFSKFNVAIKNTADTSMTGLVINGALNQQLLNVKAFANEKDLSLQSSLSLDYRANIPKWNIDMDVKQFDLAAFDLSDVPFSVKGRLNGAFKGASLDTLSGKALLSDFFIQYQERSEQIDSLLLFANLDHAQKSIDITSDFLDAQLTGSFDYPRVTDALTQHLVNYFGAISSDSLIGKTKDQFNTTIKLHNPEILTLGFLPDLKDLSPFELSAQFDNQHSIFNLETTLPYLEYQTSAFEALSFKTKGIENKANYEVSFRRAKIQEILDVINFKSWGSIEDKTVYNTIQILDEKQKKRFEIKTLFDQKENQKYRFSLLPEQLLNYQKWMANENNQILYAEEAIQVENWRLYRGIESMEVKNISKDQLEISFKQFDLTFVSDFVKVNSNYLQGVLNGSFRINDPLKQPVFTSALDVQGLVVFDAALGDLHIAAKNETEKRIQTKIKLLGNGNEVQINGYYDLEDTINVFDFAVEIPKLNLASIEPLSFGNLEKMAGILEGNFQIRGSVTHPDVTGKIQFKETAFDIAMAKTRLHLGTQPILFETHTIEFQNLEIFDANDNKGVISSYILTENYRDFFLNSNIEVKDFMILNTTAQDNDMYYGKLLVDANVALSGKVNEPIITIKAKAKKTSDLTYIYSSGSNQLEAHEGIVTFVKPKKEELHKRIPKQLLQVSEDFNMKVIVKMEVDESLNFKAITDPITGDYFEGKAKGNLLYMQKPNGTMELNGGLTVIKGTYLLTYQQLLKRPFEVVPGGTISWTGDPFTPKMDINVAYKVRTSADPLLALQTNTDDNTPTASSSPQQVFFVKINIGGTPLDTKISSSIEYPSSDGNTQDSEIQSAIDQVNQNPSQQNTQAFSLILFNGFLVQDFQATDFEAIDITGNINKMITQQLNNLANRYIKFVELDFGMESYKGNDNSEKTDFRVSIRKRFLNDRLTISLDGKTSTETRGESNSSQAYLDNITVEYALAPNGQFKIKIYNKRDFDDLVGGTGVKVGGAFVFSKDFNGIKLFDKKK